MKALRQYLESHRLQVIVFCLVVIVQITFLCLALGVEARFGDLDGDPAYSFPLIGQDAPGYLVLAQNLLRRGAFTLDGVNPEVFRTPGYPAFIALSLFLFGDLVGVIILQILLAALSAVLVMQLAERLGLSRRISVVAGLLFGWSPSVIFHTLGIFSEIPFTFLILITTALALSRSPLSKKSSFIDGLFLGLATLIRPIAFVLPIIFCGLLLWRERSRAINLILWLLLGTALVVMPWLVRNKIQTNTLALSSVSTYNLAFYNVPDFLVAKYGSDSSPVTAYRQRLAQVPAEQTQWFASQPKLQQIAQKELRGREVDYLLFHLVGTTKFFLSSSLRYIVLHIHYPAFQNWFGLDQQAPSLLDKVQQADWWSIWSTLNRQFIFSLDRLVMIILILLSLTTLLDKRERWLKIFLMVLVFTFALLTGPVSIPRYRLPVEPFLIILALMGIKNIREFFKKSSLPIDPGGMDASRTTIT